MEHSGRLGNQRLLCTLVEAHAFLLLCGLLHGVAVVTLLVVVVVVEVAVVVLLLIMSEESQSMSVNRRLLESVGASVTVCVEINTSEL